MQQNYQQSLENRIPASTPPPTSPPSPTEELKILFETVKTCADEIVGVEQ